MKNFLLFLLYHYNKKIDLIFPIDSLKNKVVNLLKNESKIHIIKIQNNLFKFEYETLSRRLKFEIVIYNVSDKGYSIKIILNVLQRILYVLMNLFVLFTTIIIIVNINFKEALLILIIPIGYLIIHYSFILYRVTYYEERIKNLIIDLQD